MNQKEVKKPTVMKRIPEAEYRRLRRHSKLLMRLKQRLQLDYQLVSSVKDDEGVA